MPRQSFKKKYRETPKPEWIHPTQEDFTFQNMVEMASASKEVKYKPVTKKKGHLNLKVCQIFFHIAEKENQIEKLRQSLYKVKGFNC